ncbi:hypothetical protein AACH06_28675 [Ideonella sp. DXS29W]|uniref:N-acetyltransferase domain-containing protein n=1 Tax=Ideonella lacteola TaxID=2984193 RepID=A0ABU9BXV3_9BURK
MHRSRGPASMRRVSNPLTPTMQLATSEPVFIRALRPADIDRLLVLEHRRWTTGQAASAETLLQRIHRWPKLSMGAFGARSGAALASLFLRPATAELVRAAHTWYECAEPRPGEPPAEGSHTLFGISLTSVHPGAVRPMLQHLWLQAVQSGWREVYLGSPMPGLRRAIQRRPDLEACSYAHQRRRGGPVDPQLRYYHRLGFCEIVAVRAGYFPHEESLDHGAVLRHVLPYGHLDGVLRRLPLEVLRQIAAGLYGAGRPAMADDQTARPTTVEAWWL